jgi:hypothetical protein
MTEHDVTCASRLPLAEEYHCDCSGVLPVELFPSESLVSGPHWNARCLLCRAEAGDRQWTEDTAADWAEAHVRRLHR